MSSENSEFKKKRQKRAVINPENKHQNSSTYPNEILREELNQVNRKQQKEE